MKPTPMRVLDPSHDQGPQPQIAPVPRVSVQAFCETPALTALVQEAARDRRMIKAHVKAQMGGAAAAIEAYRTTPTPNVIVLEAPADRAELNADLDALSEYCDAGTKVVVAGKLNDIALYRELMARGVSEYLIAPFGVMDFIRAISDLYATPGVQPLGRVIAFCGAKGGVGSSVIAHNVAWSIARDLDTATVVVDLDLAYGTTGLDFNQDPPQGIAEAVFAPDRLDSNFLDRLLSKCADKLNILAAPATLERNYDFDEAAFDGIIDVLRASVPVIVLDVPHVWTAWTRHLLVSADEVVIVAAPELASLRNAKNIGDTLKAARPNDSRPRLILNGVGVPKRPEISVADFCRTIELDALASVPFDPKLFGTAGNNGQMVGEVDGSSKTAELFTDLARTLTGRGEQRRARKTILDPLLLRLNRKRAS